MVSRSAGSEPTGRRAVRLVLPFLALLLAAAPALGQSAGGLAPATGQDDGFGGTALPDAGAVDSAPIEPIAPVEGVEAESLPPVLTADGAGLPAELWQGIGVEEVDGLFSKLDIPPRSAALHSLWRRLLTADVTPPAAGKVPGHFEALRLEGMTRTGLLEAAMQLIAKEGAAAASPLALTAKARTELGLGKTDAACATAKGLPLKGNSLPGRIREEALLIVAYCVAKDRKPDRAALAAEVLRSEKVKAPLALPVIVAGVRTAAIEVVGSATLAAFVGAGGLGTFITAGITLMDERMLLTGAIAVTMLALLAEFLLARLEHRLTPAGLRPA